jgi:3',5'-cyclic AMP phosphodiesterase CpdA
MLDKGFVHEKVKALAKLAAQAQRGLAAQSADFLALAELYQVEPVELTGANEILAQLVKNLPGVEDPDLWFPRDPACGIVQAALESFYRKQAGAVVKSGAKGLVAGSHPVSDEELATDPLAEAEPLFQRFEKTDVRWGATFGLAKALARARGRYRFPTAPPTVPLAENARVVLVGDWASGLPRARKVADEIRKVIDDATAASRQNHVIHLGDVYYAGLDDEFDFRFLRCWPVDRDEADAIGSWALNGNHEMFAGGHSYFERLLGDIRFTRQAKCSYFLLENSDWQIFGLDSAYEPRDWRGEEGDLYGDQPSWVSLKRAAAPHKKPILLTHHQLFSAYERGADRMRDRLASVLPVTAWFWGHEHRCVVYDRNRDVHHPRLVGHGGIPVRAGGPAPDRVRAPIVYEYEDSFPWEFSRLRYFGFCVLDFDGPVVCVRYINENGHEHYAETIQ